MINFEKQLMKFYSVLDYIQISANAITLYLVLMQIASLVNESEQFIAKKKLIQAKIKNFSEKALERARNELIQNNLILYKKGKNQNVDGVYTIVDLIKNENIFLNDGANVVADVGANVGANVVADEHAYINKTKLNYIYINIINNSAEKLEEFDFRYDLLLGYTNAIKHLNILLRDRNGIGVVPTKVFLKYAIINYALKEIYLSPDRVYIKHFSEDLINEKFLKTEKYILRNQDLEELEYYDEFIAYFISCLQKSIKREY